jgi:lipid II:glycine glycyltransferase (peptidoglycan interpeptide bridge formation enzyme)
MSNIPTPSGSLVVKVDGQTPESWSAVLAQFTDANFYQTWAYGAVRWGSHNLSHLVIRRQGQVVAAAQLRIARLPLIPAGVAYLRWGPVCQVGGSTLDPTLVTETISALLQEYVKHRGLALQVIPHAFSGSNRAAAVQSAFNQSLLKPEPCPVNYQTVLVDLSSTREIVRRRLDQKWRNQLNRAEKNGLTFEVSDSDEAYSEFERLYMVMRQQKQFETSVDVREFGQIQKLLFGPEKMQTFIARKGGRAIAALVCSLLGDTAIYLLGATNEEARELKAAYLLQWQAMLWLKEHGACAYDLGGIDPEANPGGYHFKSGFGGQESTQLRPHTASGGVLGDAVLRGAIWLRRRRTPSSKSIQIAN